MKTKYLAELELRNFFGQANPYYGVVSDPLSINMFIGLLSAMPDNFAGGAGDNWTGARELFSNPSDPYINPATNEVFPGIKKIGPTQGYSPKLVTKAEVSEPYVTYNPRLDSSGITVEFPILNDISFNFAESNWGLVKGIVLYGASFPGGNVALVPILVTDLVTPINIQQGQKFRLSSSPQNRVRFTELLRKLPLI
jgi:hypothetical protein